MFRDNILIIWCLILKSYLYSLPPKTFSYIKNNMAEPIALELSLQDIVQFQTL